MTECQIKKVESRETTFNYNLNESKFTFEVNEVDKYYKLREHSYMII